MTNSCGETCKIGITAGSFLGGLAGFAADVCLSIIYVRPFVDHLTHTDSQTEVTITGVIAFLALPLFVVPGAMLGKIVGAPTAVALQGLYACGSAGLSALSSLSLFRHQPPATAQVLGETSKLISEASVV